MRAKEKSGRGRPPLPVAIVAAMLAIGAGLELVLDGRLDGAPKLPLAALVVLALARGEPPGRR